MCNYCLNCGHKLTTSDSTNIQLMNWLEDYPPHYNGGTLCDAWVGYCSCGGYHKMGEFELRDGVLYRYGKAV